MGERLLSDNVTNPQIEGQQGRTLDQQWCYKLCFLFNKICFSRTGRVTIRWLWKMLSQRFFSTIPLGWSHQKVESIQILPSFWKHLWLPRLRHGKILDERIDEVKFMNVAEWHIRREAVKSCMQESCGFICYWIYLFCFLWLLPFP